MSTPQPPSRKIAAMTARWNAIVPRRSHAMRRRRAGGYVAVSRRAARAMNQAGRFQLQQDLHQESRGDAVGPGNVCDDRVGEGAAVATVAVEGDAADR